MAGIRLRDKGTEVTTPSIAAFLPADEPDSAGGVLAIITYGNLRAWLQSTLSIAQSRVTGLTTDLANKAALVHTHVIADVTGLQAALDAAGSGGGGSGSVTSVALTAPAIFSVTGTPVTTSGTLTISLALQAANLVWSGPTTGSAAVPTFRSLVAADLPTITSLGTVTTGVWSATTISIAKGGTGATTATAGFDALSPMTTVGDTIYGGTAGTRTRLAGNATTSRMFLRQTGSGAASAAPTWDTLLAADLPNAVSDGSTKGVAAFVAADFTDSGGVVGIDYVNGQAASASTKGFVSAADWLVFNAKVSPINGGLETIDTTHGSMGSTETFSLSAGNWHTGTLNANCIFTISGWTAAYGCTLFLGLTQDATGGRTITWPAAVVNPPAISTTANAITWVSLWSINGGTTIYASTPIGVAAEANGNVTISGVLSVSSATATPAGGSTAARLVFGTTAGFGIYYGSGAPTVSAAQGSVYMRSDGSSSSTRLYVNSDGATTWVNVTTAS